MVKTLIIRNIKIKNNLKNSCIIETFVLILRINKQEKKKIIYLFKNRIK